MIVKHVKLFALLAILVTVVSVSRNLSGKHVSAQASSFYPSTSNHLVLLALSGHLPTLVSDFQVLDFFDIYYAMQEEGKQEYAPLLAASLQRAVVLDPYFIDSYRLSSSILAYDANMADEAVSLLERGTDALPSNWQIPFFGGFVAHQQLHDDARAFTLMKKVLNRPEAPQVAIGLAARFLSNTSTKEDTITFLRSMLLTLPDDFKKGVEDKIAKIEAGEKK